MLAKRIYKTDFKVRGRSVYLAERRVEGFYYARDFRLPEEAGGGRVDYILLNARAYTFPYPSVERVVESLSPEDYPYSFSQSPFYGTPVGSVLVYYYPKLHVAEVWEGRLFPEEVGKDYEEKQREFCLFLERLIAREFNSEKIYWHDVDIAVEGGRYGIYLQGYEPVEGTNLLVKNLLVGV